MTTDIAYIYVLRDPDTLEIRYVGKTDNLERRLSVHYADAIRGHTHCNRWVRTLRDKGKRPVIEAVEQTTSDEWEERERYWIDYLRAQGCRLTNTAEGGAGGAGPHTADARAKISQARRGMRFTQEHRNQLRKHKDELYSSEHGRQLKEQYSRAYAALTDEQVIEVWTLAHQGGISQEAIARMYHVPQSTVSEIKSGKRYQHVPRPHLPLLKT